MTDWTVCFGSIGLVLFGMGIMFGSWTPTTTVSEWWYPGVCGVMIGLGAAIFVAYLRSLK